MGRANFVDGTRLGAIEIKATCQEITMQFSIFRYHPERDEMPYMQPFEVDLEPTDRMLLDVILRIKAQDDSLTIRKSCREGVCGSDAININGRNGLACITPVRELRQPVQLRPLPSFPVIRDLVVDMTQFFKQYYSIKPYLINDEPAPQKERLQSPEDRNKLDGYYECILCACCTSQCPSSWWNPDTFVGPAGLLQAYRFIIDSRDRATQERLDDLNDPFHELYRGLSQRPGSIPCDREDQATNDQTSTVTVPISSACRVHSDARLTRLLSLAPEK
jgi:succinate dehydrogenase / fumarate reductase iron-sulfur subunit